MDRLKNKVALITGGSRGIGAAIARRLSKEGAAVAFTYTNAREKAEEVVMAIESSGGKGLAIVADSADPQAVITAVRQTVAVYGRIDILVSNAGIFISKPLEEQLPEDFDLIMAVNVRAVFVGALEASRHMARGSRIITIGSCMADRAGRPGASLYAMSKSALSGFTIGMARDMGARGITVNLVQPGPIDTDMNPANGPHADMQRAMMALSEYGTGDDIAGLVAYLACEESKYMTGATLTIDGGVNA